MKESFKAGVISEDDFKYGTDVEFIQRVSKSENGKIVKLLEIIKNLDAYYSIATKENHHVHQPIKLRAMDPWVLDSKTAKLKKIIRVKYAISK
ncbi:MAG: hypothetical protein HOI53_02785 [Francisellaceae bacterium]|nr:hypothetical protein [Francisellaceae bacterium]MBT6206930.1 hypothetical protein [Francisellaceae bacterium]MBT6538493.1 hypothetical protein [Francisellaceae bacterium]